jgi:hypothetical protein
MTMSEHHKDQILDVLMYVATPEVRQRLALEVPAAYNAWCGRNVVTVNWTGEGEVRLEPTPKAPDAVVAPQKVRRSRDQVRRRGIAGDPLVTADVADAALDGTQFRDLQASWAGGDVMVIVDETAGGIIAYAPCDQAERIVKAVRFAEEKV